MVPLWCFSSIYESREAVLRVASLQNLPIVAVFLGDDGCPWSQKIEKELFNSPFFQENVGTEALIWQITLSCEREGHEIEQEYKIEQFPSILLLDPSGKEFARLDYDASEPVVFSKRILSLIHDFHEVCQAIDQGFIGLNEEILQTRYLQASRLSTPCFKQIILSQGLKKEKGTFFHLEKYALLLNKLKLKHAEVLKLRKELLSRDPANRWETQYKIALLEFEKRKTSLKRKDRIEKAIIPLVEYLTKFGESDEKNRWRVELMIAEFLFSNKALPAAFEYVKAAKEHVPQEYKSQVLKTIAYMRGSK